jgi:hypothetical protein
MPEAVTADRRFARVCNTIFIAMLLSLVAAWVGGIPLLLW